VQATAAGVGVAVSGTIRDVVNGLVGATDGLWGVAGSANGYLVVYTLEIALLVVTLAAIAPLLDATGRRHTASRQPAGTGTGTATANPDAALTGGDTS
jgi:BCD family chlorophyll transporter-like MFS transporter